MQATSVMACKCGDAMLRSYLFEAAGPFPRYVERKPLKGGRPVRYTRPITAAVTDALYERPKGLRRAEILASPSAISLSSVGWPAIRTSDNGLWLLSIDHSGVAAEIGALPASAVSGPGLSTFALANLSDLYGALDRTYKLAISLPDAPLERFRRETANLPRTTEAERLLVQRSGQNMFREALLDYWGGRCPMTGITELALLRASHIVPWAECGDEQRLDVHNGLLLSALWDAAFDHALVSFADDRESACKSQS
jgi:hypothetical protein